MKFGTNTEKLNAASGKTMNIQNNIDRLRIGGIIILILITLLIPKCVGDKKNSQKNQENNIEQAEPFIESKPDTVFVDTPVDTASIIKYCIENGLYKELFPKKTITKIVKEQQKTEEPDEEEANKSIPQIDTVFISNTVEVPCAPIFNFIKPEEKIRPFVGFGINTFPSVSIMAGAMFKNNWGIAIESHYYFYHGIIKNATVPDNVNFIVRTKSAIAEEAPPIGYVEIPNFSVGLKVIKMF